MTDTTPSRTWQEIATEIERERDNEKLIDLTFELLRALPEPFTAKLSREQSAPSAAIGSSPPKSDP
jgi:hypothetical protein